MEQLNNIETNPMIERLPNHLKQFIKPQQYDDYSSIDQAVWRYVMRKNLVYLSQNAHESYIEGLEKTGIEIEDIPSMYGMNRILKEIGWAAVAVDGFIPPNAFMEFQAYKVLVIASDIRQLEHMEYTPAPDIIHESAGHAPIIANPDYAEYLRRLGEIGAKAILSKHDYDVYEAVRKLSILEEAKDIPLKELEAARNAVNDLQEMDVELSEMAKIRNLQWWSVEYGLIGTMDDPKIYGAGLLSSIGESKWCMSDQVTKIPYTLDVASKSFDITKPQPQLFVTPDFSYLMHVLEELATTFSVRKGGRRGIERLIESQMVGTIELNTGLQVSGNFERVILNEDNQVVFFKTTGPTALSYREKELIGHGIKYHKEGFSSPLGRLKNINLAIEDMGPFDLKAYNFYDGKALSFEFESGIHVKGLNVTGIRNIKGQLMLIQLKDCTITYKGEELYKPEYGVYDMVVGQEIVSAFAGAADPNSFENLYEVSQTKTIKSAVSEDQLKLRKLYEQVKSIRNETIDKSILNDLVAEILTNHANEWLLQLEMLEICQDETLAKSLEKNLDRICTAFPDKSHLIIEGKQLFRENMLV